MATPRNNYGWLKTAGKAGLGIGANLLMNAFGPKLDFNMINPADYKSQLLLGGREETAIRNKAKNDIGQQTAAGNQNIKQAGAFNGLSAGDLFSSFNQNTANAQNAVAGLEPQIAKMKRDAFANYLQMQQGYDISKMNAEMYNQDMTRQGLGTISKIMTLWAGGQL